MTRPLPWHDTPTCREPDCGGPVVIDDEVGCLPMCGACGTLFKNAAPAERAQIRKAEEAWDLVLTGKVHEDKACSRCGGVLPIEQTIMYPPCVAEDTDERTIPLFPGAHGGT